MNGVFISYRRSDSGGHAGRIHDGLVKYYGDGRVFRDIEDIAAGDDFVLAIRETLAKYDVVLVVIGPSWLTLTDDSGHRRLDNPKDLVRLEIAEALERRGTRVIPVLVDGAKMPAAEDLPKPLVPLATRNAFEVLDTRFADDVARLIKTIGGQPAGRVRKLALAGGFGLLTISAGAIIFASILGGPPKVAADITLYGGEGSIDENENGAIATLTLSDTSTVQTRNVRVGASQSPSSLSYEFVRHNQDSVTVTPLLAYRELLETGGPIGGANGIFWDWPRLSVKIVNTSEETLYISSVEIEVTKSDVDTEPLMFIGQRIDGSASFHLSNEGWGDAVGLSIEVSVHEGLRCRDDQWSETPRRTVDLRAAEVVRSRLDGDGPPTVGGAGTTTRIDVAGLVPPSLQSTTPEFGEFLCVLGVLDYETQTGEERSVRFKTRIRQFGQSTAASISPSDEHYVFLEAGSSGHVESISVDYAVQPNGVEHFLLRIATDKSASFDLTVGLQAIGRDLLLADHVGLTILTPVTDTYFLRNRELRHGRKTVGR